MSKLGGNAHQKYVATMLRQKEEADMPKPNWTPLKHTDIRMAEALKRCEEYRAIKSLDMDSKHEA